MMCLRAYSAGRAVSDTREQSAVSGRRHSRRVPDPRELSHATSTNDDVINYPSCASSTAAATNTLFTPNEKLVFPTIRRRRQQPFITSTVMSISNSVGINLETVY